MFNVDTPNEPVSRRRETFSASFHPPILETQIARQRMARTNAPNTAEIATENFLRRRGSRKIAANCGDFDRARASRPLQGSGWWGR